MNAALSEADALSVYGVTFDDGEANGKGVHDIDLDTSTKADNQDGALVVYAADADGKVSQRTRYFLKFDNQDLPG